jgi:membrane protein implicated in regulation of membrane protease activity
LTSGATHTKEKGPSMSGELHWLRAAVVVALLGALMVGGYLATSPGATTGVALGMALAFGAVEAALGIVFAISRRHARMSRR